MTVQFKTKIIDVKDSIPLDKEGYLPGALIKAKENGKAVGNPMRVVQVAGPHVLVEYIPEP